MIKRNEQSPHVSNCCLKGNSSVLLLLIHLSFSTTTERTQLPEVVDLGIPLEGIAVLRAWEQSLQTG